MKNPDNKKPETIPGKVNLIDHIAGKVVPGNKSTFLGIGDDAAVIENGDSFLLVSTDLLLEGIHFNLVYFPLRHLGYKTVIRGISDIMAMNGKPEQIFLGMGLSSRFTTGNIDEILSGALLACEKYHVDLAGGDTTSSLTGLTLSVTATGRVEKEKLARRNGARPNDLICVTGNLGAAYTGLQILERERKIFGQDSSIQPDLSGYEYILGRQLKPELPLKILEELNSVPVSFTSMIDITDGLASDLMQICKASQTGCRIFSQQIPVDYETSRAAEEMNLDPLVPALHGGDDFELLFTVPLEAYDQIRNIKSVTAIGHITERISGNYIVGADGSEVELTAQGWSATE